jgi:hypothetical protein
MTLEKFTLENTLDELKWFVHFLIRPSYWSQLYDVDMQWDAELNRLLDQHEFTNIGQYTAKLGDTSIWISNHPFASFTEYHRLDYAMARRRTIWRAKQKLDAATENLK